MKKSGEDDAAELSSFPRAARRSLNLIGNFASNKFAVMERQDQFPT